jgi:hypothetical protein
MLEPVSRGYLRLHVFSFPRTHASSLFSSSSSYYYTTMPGGGGNAWPALEGAPGATEPKTLHTEHEAELRATSGPFKQSGQRVNKKISEALEIVLTYSDYLLEISLNASLEGINTKFERLLHDVDNIRQGIDAQKTEIKTIATTILPRLTGRGPIQLPQATWAQAAAMVTPPSLSRTTSNSSRSTPGMTFQELRQDCEVIFKVGDGQSLQASGDLQAPEHTIRHGSGSGSQTAQVGRLLPSAPFGCGDRYHAETC